MAIQHVRLINGLTVLFVPRAGTDTTTAMAVVGLGSRAESAAVSGISHFIEHMTFKGTVRRPTTSHISQELDGVGADYNAYTSREWTGYYIKTDTSHLPLALDVLSDILFCSVDSAEHIKSEKGVIVEEIRMYQDNPLLYVEDVVEQLVFGRHPLGRDIAGTAATVRGLTRVQIQQFRQRYYQPRDMILVVAGKLPNATRALVRRTFGQKIPHCAKPTRPQTFHSTQAKPRQRIVYRKTDQVQAAFAWPAVSRTNAKVYAATILGVILGGTMSSRLFITVRDREGLAYSIRARHTPFADTGIFTIQGGFAADHWQQAFKSIRREVDLLCADGISGAELERAKEFLRGKIAIDLEDSAQMADWYGKMQLLMGKIMTPAEYLEKISAVTVADVTKIARIIFNHRRINCAVIGPVRTSATVNPWQKR